MEKAHKKKQDECLKRWKKLIAGLTIRQRLTSEYISQNEPISNGVEGDNDDDDETTEEPAGQFKDVEADDAELAARAAPVTQQKSKPTMLRLTHNQLPPMQEELRRQKQQQQQDSSDDEQEEEEPEPSEEEAKPVKRAPRRKAARKRSVVALDSEDESEPSDSDLEEIKPAIKRPRRAVTQKKTVATSRPRRSTARKPQGAKGSNG